MFYNVALLLSTLPSIWTMPPEALANLEDLEVFILACQALGIVEADT